MHSMIETRPHLSNHTIYVVVPGWGTGMSGLSPVQAPTRTYSCPSVDPRTDQLDGQWFGG